MVVRNFEPYLILVRLLVNYFPVYTPLEAFLSFPPFPMYIISISLASLCNCYFVLLHYISNMILHWHGRIKISIYGLFFGAILRVQTTLLSPLWLLCSRSPYNNIYVLTLPTQMMSWLPPSCVLHAPWQKVKCRVLKVGPHHLLEGWGLFKVKMRDKEDSILLIYIYSYRFK